LIFKARYLWLVLWIAEYLNISRCEGERIAEHGVEGRIQDVYGKFRRIVDYYTEYFKNLKT